MGTRFLLTLDMIATKTMPSKYDHASIAPVNLKDSTLIDFYKNLGPKEEHLRQVGAGVLERGEILAIDLVAGMATGFGGTAKGSVQAILDARYEDERAMTYLDIKRSRYLDLQKKHGRHLIAAAMISRETEDSIVENLGKFAERNKVELVLLRPGTSAEEFQTIWDKFKDRWNDTIIVALIEQPTTLYISDDGRAVGKEYMKGHGDFFDVVKSQLADIMKITGVKFIFSSNIDNTGADVSESVLGHVVEEMQQKQIEAIVEVVEKYEGDKGGVPALVNGRLTILEEPFVPAEWKDQFLGKEVFPYFNTNTFWWSAEAILRTEFFLPLMETKKIPEGEYAWSKIESIMGHGLNTLRFKALVVDRGLRFLPAKFLEDLWIGRTDWMVCFKSRLMPAMLDGRYITKPLVLVSKSIFSTVSRLNEVIFGHGAYDHMRRLATMAIGGAGKHFDEIGKFETKCGVSYVGDVMILYEKRQDKASGTLIISGAKDSDMINIENSIIFVPAGETVVINKSVKDHVDPRVSKDDLAEFLKNSGKRWPESQRARIISHFFPSEVTSEELIRWEKLFSPTMLDNLTATARENAIALMKVFKPTGYLKYKVNLIGKNVYLETLEETKNGSAKNYRSKADGKTVQASPQKAYFLKHGDRLLTYACQELNCVLVPLGNEAMLLTGYYDESVPAEQKLVLLKGKLQHIIELAEQRGIEPAVVESAFAGLPWRMLFESDSRQIYDHILQISGATLQGEDQ